MIIVAFLFASIASLSLIISFTITYYYTLSEAQDLAELCESSSDYDCDPHPCSDDLNDRDLCYRYYVSIEGIIGSGAVFLLSLPILLCIVYRNKLCRC